MSIRLPAAAPHWSTSRTEVTMSQHRRHRTNRATSHAHGTATSAPSIQWTVTEVWGTATSRATPIPTATRAASSGPVRNAQWGRMSTRICSPGSNGGRAGTRQPGVVEGGRVRTGTGSIYRCRSPTPVAHPEGSLGLRGTSRAGAVARWWRPLRAGVCRPDAGTDAGRSGRRRTPCPSWPGPVRARPGSSPCGSPGGSATVRPMPTTRWCARSPARRPTSCATVSVTTACPSPPRPARAAFPLPGFGPEPSTSSP